MSLNFNRLCQQREPSKVSRGNLESILLIPGAGHTLCKISQAVPIHHWGDSTNMNDFDAWQTITSLGDKKDAPTEKKYFTSML